MPKKARTWVPYDWGVLENDKFLELSSAASLTFLVAIGYAGKLGSSKGELFIQGWGPARAQHFVRYTKLSKKRQERSIEELLACGLFEMDGETYRIPKWLEKLLEAGRSANRERQQRFRDRQRNENVTPDVTPLSQKHNASRNANVTPNDEKPLQNKGRTRRHRSRDTSADSPQTPLITPTTSFDSSPSETHTLDSVGAPAAPAEAKSWQDQLKLATRELRKRPLVTLNPNERVVVGRYHALEFSNCTKTEAFNKANGVKIAAALASMGRNKTYGELTVGQYVKFCRRVFSQREETPFFDPWLIRSAVEFEEQTA